ncbi:tetratricopeptide repeat protein 16-like [Antedon mediterranea]|uniref:tetratricopeptide repeat protein 16-like n=1 Tax=Antedon mediterranea TaxID=105859 RepID=UPI003AF5BEBD
MEVEKSINNETVINTTDELNATTEGENPKELPAERRTQENIKVESIDREDLQRKAGEKQNTSRIMVIKEEQSEDERRGNNVSEKHNTKEDREVQKNAGTEKSQSKNVDTPSEGDNRSIAPLSRATTIDNELFENDCDFPTPDYDQFLKDESFIGSEPDRMVVGRQLLSRESTKSVTFAADVKGNKKEDVYHKAMEKTAAELFKTAVSNEKIMEAKMKQDEQIGQVDTETLATDFFGGAKYKRVGIDDVVRRKAEEHFERGRQLSAMREHSKAILCFNKALNLQPKNVVFYVHRAEAYLQLCDFQSAILNQKRVCVLDPDNDKYYSKLAFMYYFQGQVLFDQCLYTESLEAFSKASEMRPEVVAYHTRSVACLSALQRHGECLALVNKRLEVEHDNPDLYIMRARLHHLFRNTTLCYYDLKDALSLDPNQEEAKTLMKQLEEKADEYRSNCIQQQLQGRFKDALQKITNAIDYNPTVPEYHILRGALHRKLHDFNASIDDYLLAMDKSGHDEQDAIYMDAQRQLLLTYNDFSVECFVRGHYNEAVVLLNKAIKGEKREKGLYINRGDCFFRLGELNFSLADYHQALELDNLDCNIHSRIARVHFEFGLLDYEEHNLQESEARFTLAMQHSPKVGSYYVYRAKVRFTMENQAGSRQDLLVALHLDPGHQDILALLPRLFPGKNVSDIIKSKAARNAKQTLDNAMITAAPVRLPAIHSATVASEECSGNSLVNSSTPQTVKLCMEEIEFNRIAAHNKKRVSNNVKKLLQDRQSLCYTGSKLTVQPAAQHVEMRGGHWKQDTSTSITGWRNYSHHSVSIRDVPT